MAHDRRFRFAVHVLRAGSAREFADGARRAEALGYSALNVPDHFVDHPLAPVPAMAAAAAVTTDLRVGSLVLDNDFKHPVVLANEAATIDLLSDGRLELGLGAGWMTADYERSGIPLDPPAVRVERLAEAITVLRGLFADGPFSFSGTHYTVTGLDGQPKPVQRPCPPLVIGGGGRRILGLAAREADIVGINAFLRGGTPTSGSSSLGGAATDRKIAWVREAAGERFDEIELQTLVGLVHFGDPRELAERLAPALGEPPEAVLQTPVVLAGDLERMVDDLLAKRDRYGISYYVIPGDHAERFAPVVARLAGT